MNAPRVVVIIPVYNEARCLPRMLESIEAQTFDRARLYVVAVDGSSDDGSREILERWLQQSGLQGCVAANPRRRIPIALNIGLKYAKAEDLVARLDAHSVYGPTYISDAVNLLQSAGARVGCVGCAYVPIPGTTFKERLVEALYTNPMGLGGADFRFGTDVRDVDNIYLGVWPASVLFAAGRFNENLDANEDAELSARIKDLGYRILRAPLPCRFIITRGPIATIRQWHRYGYWRAKMLQSNGSYLRVRHAIVLSAAPVAVALACSPARLLLIPASAAYAAIVFRHRRRGEAMSVTLATLLYFPILQFAYAAGMLAGFVSGQRTIRRRTAEIGTGSA